MRKWESVHVFEGVLCDHKYKCWTNGPGGDILVWMWAWSVGLICVYTDNGFATPQVKQR